MRVKLSVAIIVKNEPQLEQGLLSIRDHVEEIVIVDTGSTDGITQDIARKYADKFEIYTDANNPENGLIEDFARARQHSFDLASYSTVLWMDGDDILVGAEHLGEIIEEWNSSPHGLDGGQYMFPYEYAYDEQGRCTLKHYRERLIFNKNCFRWTNAVHEVIVPKEGFKTSIITRDDIIWKHQRQFSSKTMEPGRNLRILRKYYEKVGDSDARQLYYLGLECYNSGLIDEAIGFLVKYIDLSGWEDERVMACLKLVEIYELTNNLEKGLRWAFKAVQIKETWAEGYFAAAKMCYLQACQGGPNKFRNYERCAYFAKLGLKLPPTKTLLFINPLERELEVHKYLNMAMNEIGNVPEALDSVKMGLEKHPTDAWLVNNKKLYEDFLSRNEIVKNVNILKDNGTLDQLKVDQVQAIINNQPIPSSVIPTVSSEIIMDGLFPIASKSSDQKQWTIPETYDFESFPIKMTDEQLQAVVILMWKQYMLHDELLSAISFLQQAPYNVRHSFATQKALKTTQKCLMWLDNDNSFVDMNQPGNPAMESGLPLPMQLVWQEAGRFNLIANHLTPNSSLIDFGCMDGCFTNRYGLLGHKAIGLDGVKSSIDLANKKAIEFNTGSKHIHTYFCDVKSKLPNDLFDYATSSDTYEHLSDPVKDMLLPAASMLKPGGKFLLCTPHGAWMRGQFVDFADPWNQMKEGKNWLYPHFRPHLVAPSVWSVAEHFRQAGYWVKDSQVILCEDHKDVEGQGNVFVEAYLQAPNNYPKLDIVFFAGDGVETWTPETISKSGIGGSETMLLEQAKRLSLLGHKVRVYNSCGKYGEGIYDGVEYRETNKFQDLECDVLIVSRRADMLGDQFNIMAKLKLLWVHDVCAINATNELCLKADRILALSDWHRQNIITVHNVHPQHVIKTRNGIDLTRFNKSISRNQFKCVNSSSPDRSWPILLTVWSEIKKQVPQAELHLYYGFKNWEFSAQYDKLQMDLINRLKQQIADMRSLDVIYHDRVNQEQLAEEFLNAGCLLYSTWFTETGFIGGMEAQAAGLRIISSPIAAINETVGNRGTLISGEWTSQEYQKQFIEATVKALTNNDNSDRLELQKYAQQHFELNDLAKEWEEMFYQLIEEKKTNPILPYFPTTAYQIGGRGYYDGDPRFGNHNKLQVG